MREIVARRAKQIADEALMRSVHGGGHRAHDGLERNYLRARVTQ